MAETNEDNTQKRIQWIDLSAYGMKLLIVATPSQDGGRTERVLVMAGAAEAQSEPLARLGFRKHTSGAWVLTGATPSFAAIVREFPKAERLPDALLSEYYKPGNAKPTARPVAATPAQAPTQDPAPQSAPEAEGRPQLPQEPAEPEIVPLEVLLAQSKYLGLNRLGQPVHENVRGRFMQDARGRAAFESDMPGVPGLFLRAVDDASLVIAAEGFVEEIAQNKVLRLEDLRRFAQAVFDTEVADNDIKLARAHLAIEGAMARWLARKGGAGMRDIFGGAVKLHEGHAYLGDLTRHQPAVAAAVPQPLSVAAQRILGTDTDLDGKRVVVSGGGAGTLFAHLPRGATVTVFEPDARRAVHARATMQTAGRQGQNLVESAPDWQGADMVIANLERRLLDTPRTFGGMAVSRGDLSDMLDSLEARADLGRSVFMLRGGDSPEEQAEMERVREYIGARWAIEGTVDVDGGLCTGRPQSSPVRMFVVGRRRPTPLDRAPEAAMRTNEVHDFSSLWTWTAEVVANRAKIADYHASMEEALEEGGHPADPDLAENSFQAPYVSMSGIGQASTMEPRNLEGAGREARARVARRHGDIDQWVGAELAMTREQIEASFSPEQVDAVALAIDAEERGRAFLNADQTGIGKGRFLAAMMRRAAMQGRKVLFLTEKEINISDIWRDILHTGSGDELAPFIINEDVDVIDEQTEEVRLSSRGTPHTLMMKALAHLRHWPDGTRIAVHQLKPEAAERLGRKEIYLLGDAAMPEGVTGDDVARSWAFAPNCNLMIATYSQFNKPGAVDPREVRRGRRPNANVDAAAAAEAEAEAELSEKSQWLRAVVDENTYVVLDESHNAASDNSNIGKNVKAVVDAAGGVLFSSATWAKGAKNMGIYARLFPPDFDTANLDEVIRKGGETLQETMSAMLVKDGVMVRREHDLSNCDFRVMLDEAHAERNREQMDMLAPVLAEMAYLSGDLDRRVNAMNDRVEANLRRRMGGADDRAVRRRMKSLQVNRIGFGSPLTDISRLFACSLLIDMAAETALRALRENRKPVIAVESTVQKVLEEVMEAQAGEDGAPMAPDFKHLLHRKLTQATRISKLENGERVYENLAKPEPELDIAERMLDGMLAALPDTIARLDEIGGEGDPEFKAVLERALDRVAADMRRADQTVDIEVFARALERAKRMIVALPDAPVDAAPAIRRLSATLPDTPARSVRRIRAMIDALPDLPLSAIDAIKERIQAEGYTCGEITGRTLECVGGVVRPRAKVSKTVVKNDFNFGRLDAVIVNAAGATGIDLHAGRRFDDIRQREMIVAQRLADVTRQLQLYGRVNRFDQVIGPRIDLLMAGLPLESRLIAMDNAKMRRLSANLTSNRDNAMLIKGGADLINPVGDIVCARYGEARPDLMRRLGYDVDRNAQVARRNAEAEGAGQGEDTKDNQRSANEFLARLAMLSVAQQEQTMVELESEYRAAIEELDAKGENPLKSRTIEGKVHLRERTVFEGADVENPNSEFHRPVYAQRIIIEKMVEPLRGEQVANEFEKGLIAQGADTPDLCANRLARRRTALLETYLPRDAVSVADALAQGHPVITEMNRRLDALIDILGKVRPGSEVSLTADGVPEQGVVTRVLLARHYEHLASAHDIEYILPGDHMPKRTSIASLLSDPAFALGEGLNGDDYHAILRKFDEALEGSRLESRQMLVGNDWQAMNLSIQHKLGNMVAYQDDRGVVHRGVLVSKRHTNNDFALSFLPVSMQNPRMAAEAAIAGCELRGSSDLEAKGALSIKPMRDGTFLVQMPSPRSKKYGFIYEHPPIQALLQQLNVAQGGDKDKDKDPRLSVNRATLEAVIGHLINGGARFYTSSRHREWANQWMAENHIDTEAAAEAAPHPAA